MRSLLLLFITLVPAALFAQKFQVGAYLGLQAPLKSEMPKMSLNAGLGAEAAYRSFKEVPMLLSLRGSLGYYSRTTLEQTYHFDNGSNTTTNVEFTSYMNQAQFGLKFYTGKQTTPVRFFVMPQFGAAFMRTRILVKQPETESICNPLDRRAAHRYTGFTYGGEAGVEMDMSRLFSSVKTPEKHRVFFSAGFLQGIGKFDYVNIRYMKDTPAATPGRALNVAFADGTTTTIYEKKIAEIYTTNFQFISCTIGYTYNF